MVNSQHEALSHPTLETPKLGFPRRKEDTIIITNKGGDHVEKRRTRAKEKKHAASLIVGNDILITEIPDYLLLDLEGRFYGK